MLDLLLTTCTSLAVEAVYTRLTGVKFLIMSWAGSKWRGMLWIWWHFGMACSQKSGKVCQIVKLQVLVYQNRLLFNVSSSLEQQLIRHPLVTNSERCSYRYW